jgi:transcriptional antiterminator RfaH
MTPEPQWLVAYTKPRGEKKLAEHAAKLGLEVYLPLKRERRKWSDRMKWVEMPLLPSHLFVKIEPERREALYNSPGFVRYLFWLKRPAVVKNREIALLKAWMNDFDHGQIQIRTIAPGQKVQVQTGPLMGRIATVAEQRGQHLQLILQDIGLIIQVSVAETQIEVIS